MSVYFSGCFFKPLLSVWLAPKFLAGCTPPPMVDFLMSSLQHINHSSCTTSTLIRKSLDFFFPASHCSSNWLSSTHWLNYFSCMNVLNFFHQKMFCIFAIRDMHYYFLKSLNHSLIFYLVSSWLQAIHPVFVSRWLHLTMQTLGWFWLLWLSFSVPGS